MKREMVTSMDPDMHECAADAPWMRTVYVCVVSKSRSPATVKTPFVGSIAKALSTLPDTIEYTKSSAVGRAAAEDAPCEAAVLLADDCDP